MYIAAPSSSNCSHTLAVTDITCSHEVAVQSQPTLLLPSSSSTVAATLGCHLPLGDFTPTVVISFARLHKGRLNQDAQRTKAVARPTAQRLSAPSTTSRSPQSKKLTREEFRDRSTKGLCWHCNKLWSQDHHFKKKRPLLVEPTKEPKLKDMTLESEEKDMKEKPQSAAHTFHAPPQILHIDGFIKHQPVTILADTRSSNDLMNDKRKQVTLCGKGENEEKMIST
ncbi:hypothetical protein GW17_00062330 [Ensete ventricosum]|nr:hypothetical protein GW17_00062330 [Ensete ventricosum]